MSGIISGYADIGTYVPILGHVKNPDALLLALPVLGALGVVTVPGPGMALRHPSHCLAACGRPRPSDPGPKLPVADCRTRQAGLGSGGPGIMMAVARRRPRPGSQYTAAARRAASADC
jgi:hypothetical protein